MLRTPDTSEQVVITPIRIVALDRARTFITLLVLLHHSVVNYTYFGSGDRMRWLGFDLVVLFNDSFFMACMFRISGLFVRDSLARRGAPAYLANRAWRLGVPYLLSIILLMPIAYYPTFLRYHLPDATDFNFLHFWWRTLAVGPRPSGPAWFLWVLLAFDAIAALVWSIAPRAIEALGKPLHALRYRPGVAFAAVCVFSIIVYLPLRLPYKGAAPAITDLLGGQIQVMFTTVASAASLIESGQLRALAVTSAQRSPAFPNVPTVAEAGVPGYSAESWYGLFVPAKTPPQIIDRLNKSAAMAVKSEAFNKLGVNEGLVMVASPPGELDRYVRGEEERWRKVIQEAGIKIE